jgi:cytoplasmic iron level regulating protein YaaA (DUF328/UPF0246 family)
MSLAFAYSLQPDAIYILSAKYGLVDLAQELEPYEQTLNTTSAGEIRKWAERVKDQMKGKIDPVNDEVVFLAGEKYRKYLIPIFHKTNIPLKGLSIGKQLQYLKNKTNYVHKL